MALHLEYSRDSYPLDGYTSYSDSSAPRTPSPREDAPYPAVFTGEPEHSHIMHPEYQQSWTNHETYNFNHHPSEGREPYEGKRPSDPYLEHSAEPSYNGKGAPDMPSPEMRREHPRESDMHPSHRQDYPPHMRRATFPYVRHDRDRDDVPLGTYPSTFLHHQQPPVGNGMYAEHDYPHHPPPGSHPPYHEYDQQQAYYHRPPPQHYGHPMSMPMHGHPLSMTYISPHTGLPVQHTDDAASKETQYLRRRCFNCHTTEPPSWRRSTLNPGKIVCNKCGLYERTHLRPRPLRFDELRAGNKARKTGPGAKTSKKAQAAAAQAAVSAPPPPGGPNGGGPPDEMAGKGEPRDYNLVRRSSVSSSGSSSNGHSDWESAYSSSSGSAPHSGPSTTFSSPSSGSYPLPRDSHSPVPHPSEGIRLPSAPLSDLGGPHHSSPLMTHQSPHMMSHPLPANGQQLLHPMGRSPPRKSHTFPTNIGNGHYRESNGSSHSLHTNGDSPGRIVGSPAA